MNGSWFGKLNHYVGWQRWRNGTIQLRKSSIAVNARNLNWMLILRRNNFDWMWGESCCWGKCDGESMAGEKSQRGDWNSEVKTRFEFLHYAIHKRFISKIGWKKSFVGDRVRETWINWKLSPMKPDQTTRNESKLSVNTHTTLMNSLCVSKPNSNFSTITSPARNAMMFFFFLWRTKNVCVLLANAPVWGKLKIASLLSYWTCQSIPQENPSSSLVMTGSSNACT